MEFGIPTPLLVGLLVGLMALLQALFRTLTVRLDVRAYDVAMALLLLGPAIVVGLLKGLQAGFLTLMFLYANLLLHTHIVMRRFPPAKARVRWRFKDR